MAAPGGHAPSPSRVHDLQRKEETEDPDHVLQGEEGPLLAPGPDPGLVIGIGVAVTNIAPVHDPEIAEGDPVLALDPVTMNVDLKAEDHPKKTVKNLAMSESFLFQLYPNAQSKALHSHQHDKRIEVFVTSSSTGRHRRNGIFCRSRSGSGVFG